MRGITGWGEAFAQGLEPPEIAATVIDKALRSSSSAPTRSTPKCSGTGCTT
jgi:hypothetical protein